MHFGISLLDFFQGWRLNLNPPPTAQWLYRSFSKNFFLISTLNVPWCSWRLCALVLSALQILQWGCAGGCCCFSAKGKWEMLIPLHGLWELSTLNKPTGFWVSEGVYLRVWLTVWNDPCNPSWTFIFPPSGQKGSEASAAPFYVLTCSILSDTPAPAPAFLLSWSRSPCGCQTLNPMGFGCVTSSFLHRFGAIYEIKQQKKAHHTQISPWGSWIGLPWVTFLFPTKPPT